MQSQANDDGTAVAHLPGLDIEIHHRVAPDGLSETISINATATPSFEAFARSVELLSPVGVLAHATRLALLPWVIAAQVLLPHRPVLPPMPTRNPRRVAPFAP